MFVLFAAMKVIFVFPYAPSYREPIYKLLDDNMDCEFHFSPSTYIKMRYMDYSVLKKCEFDIEEKVIHGDWIYFKGVNKIDLSSATDLILPGTIRNLSVWLLLLKVRLFYPKIKTFLWTHGAYGRESGLQYLVKRIFFKLATHLLLYGNYAKEIILKHHLASSRKVVLVYNSLDYDKQVVLRDKPIDNKVKEHFANDYKTIIFVGRLTSEKKLTMLLQAISILENSKGEYYNCILVGEGKEYDGLAQMARDLHIHSRVWLYGACFDDVELSSLLRYSDLCVSPGNVGLTAIHALMYGVPVITHSDFRFQGPEFEAIISGVTGDFFEKDSVESLADCISKWFLKNRNTEEVKRKCYHIVDTYYNPHVQLEILKDVL